MDKEPFSIWKGIAVVCGIFLGLSLLLAIFLPSRYPPLKKYGQAEARSNLYNIRIREERYFSENGAYLECAPSPTDGGTDSVPDEWNDNGGFTKIGFEPDMYVRFQYAVRVTDDGNAFVATAMSDLDNDGEQVVYMIDSRSASYPRILKSGDEW